MYTLVRIDLQNANISADLFEEDRYSTVTQDLSLEKVLDTAVYEFFNANPTVRSWKEWTQTASAGAYEFEIVTDESTSIFRASILLKGKVMGALFLARKYHAGMKRKGDDHEYIIHILEITRLLDKRDFKPDVIAAAFCHDLLEDTECKEKEIERTCGKEVLRIVKAVSNDKSLDSLNNWERKKEKYIQSVKDGGVKAIAVCIADKVVNLNSLLKAYDRDGPKVWKRFNRGKTQKLWFEKSVLAMARQNWKNELVKEYSGLVKDMEMLADLDVKKSVGSQRRTKKSSKIKKR